MSSIEHNDSGSGSTRSKILTNLRLVLVHLRGSVSRADLERGQVEMLREPAFEPDFRQLIDAREVTAMDFDSSSMHTLSNKTSFQPGTQRAFVASRIFVYGMARMYEGYASNRDQQFQVFQDLEAACAWLGVTLEEIETALASLDEAD